MKPKKPKLISLDKFEKELRKDHEYRKNEKEMKRELMKPKKPIKGYAAVFNDIGFHKAFIFDTKKQAKEILQGSSNEYSIIPFYISFTKPE